MCAEGNALKIVGFLFHRLEKEIDEKNKSAYAVCEKVLTRDSRGGCSEAKNIRTFRLNMRNVCRIQTLPIFALRVLP